MREFESFKRIGTEPHRSYYIPFAQNDAVRYNEYGIIDRTSSSRFISLDGIWQITAHDFVDELSLDEELDSEIPVPSCVQMHGYDQIQYLNVRYPFPVLLPHIPNENPCWHYRRAFDIEKLDGERYYLNFEGVDSAFYLCVNGKYKGYSQISHATSEFDITELVKDGKNTLDVFVLKWCISTYLECQDKFRFSGIFRSVYILSRPECHITDYKIETAISNTGGTLTFINESAFDVSLLIEGVSAVAKAGERAVITLDGINPWSAENPSLYTLEISARGEKIIERVGFREVSIDGKVFKLNGTPVKLKGVNRHDFNCDRAAAVTLSDMATDIRLMKELNVNAVRTSHYPNAPEFYLLCDAVGIYVMDEADLEMHGAYNRQANPAPELWYEYAESDIFGDGITDRHTALVERDKNRTSVIIWSLGNESSFGKAFFEGAKYIKGRDRTRPVHYEGLQAAEEKYYYTDLVDMVSMMYPSPKTIRERILENPKETRPFVMCEYTHAMGNSCGDIARYWELIYSNEQMMGAFVWEWADHAIRTERGFLYGGDFGEAEHDKNFCCDGLLTPDRKLKSTALEMKAVYGGKLSSEIKDIPLPTTSKSSAASLKIKANERTGELTSVKADGKEILLSPLHINFRRYTDNDRNIVKDWNDKLRLPHCRPYILEREAGDGHYRFVGAIAANTLEPAIDFVLEYEVEENALSLSLEYSIADYVKFPARVGVEFAVDKKYSAFSYIGFGPTESYVDKHVAAEYGYYESTAVKNYDRGYVRPQESGSHHACKYLELKGLFSLTADAPFSCSVTPFTTAQLCDTTHDFELPENNFVNVCVDIAMRGIGSASCGPKLDERFEIPRRAKNTFKFIF